jgi:hypothetical protein
VQKKTDEPGFAAMGCAQQGKKKPGWTWCRSMIGTGIIIWQES